MKKISTKKFTDICKVEELIFENLHRFLVITFLLNFVILTV
jgi:hypothetical protein